MFDLAQGEERFVGGERGAPVQAEGVPEALGSWGVTAPLLVDKDGTDKREAGVTALPATLVLDASGAVKWVAPPIASAEEVVAAVP